MKLKTILAAAVIAATPAFAFAEGCSWSKQMAMSCADGMVYDHESNTCVQVTG